MFGPSWTSPLATLGASLRLSKIRSGRILSNPRSGYKPLTHFPGVLLQPLGHLSRKTRSRRLILAGYVRPILDLTPRYARGQPAAVQNSFRTNFVEPAKR